MTSKHCFFKYMKEDFKHKRWMLALSIIGNLFALPIAFYVYSGNHMPRVTSELAERFAYKIQSASHFIRLFAGTGMCMTAGFIAIVGAVIVAMASFRYLHSKSMADTFQSIPLKRKSLFLSGYLNGFLIWFVPFLASFLIMTILAAFRLNELNHLWVELPEYAKEAVSTAMPLNMGDFLAPALVSIGLLILAFFLVYHLVLLAFELSGNALNTLALSGIFGMGMYFVYVFTSLLVRQYFQTWINMGNDLWQNLAMLASPAVLAIRVLFVNGTGSTAMILAATGIALLMGIGAYMVFLKRPAQLAEQGVRNNAIRLTAQFIAAFVGGCFGWFATLILVSGFTDELVLNGIGAIFVAVLAFGVLEIIFSMDMKAFFRKMKWMLVSAVVPVVFCFLFALDAFGYDTYLPKKTDIESVGLMVNGYSGAIYYDLDMDSEDYPLNRMRLTDIDSAYEFLESAVKHVKSADTSEQYEYYDDTRIIYEGIDFSVSKDVYEENDYSESIDVKVNLKNGRSYYRRYYYSSKYGTDALQKLVYSPQYIDVMYQIPEAVIEKTDIGYLQGARGSRTIGNGSENKGVTREELQNIIRAYNQDLKLQPELLVNGKGHVTATLDLEISYVNGDNYRPLCLMAEMENTMKALKDCGLERFASTWSPDEVTKMELSSGIMIEEDNAIGREEYRPSPEEFINYITRLYDVDYSYNPDINRSLVGEKMQRDVLSTDVADFRNYSEVVLQIIDQESIAELLEHSRYAENYGGNEFFHEKMGVIMYVYGDNGEISAYELMPGTLPKKYMEYFQILADANYGEKLVKVSSQ